LIVRRWLLEKVFCSAELNYVIAKILYAKQSKYKTARDFEPALGKPQNQWAAPYAAQELLGQKPESEILVGSRGLEPILARIADPPPAAAERRPASQKNFLYNFRFACVPETFFPLRKRVFCSALL
jgi:hypothetical protein